MSAVLVFGRSLQGDRCRRGSRRFGPGFLGAHRRTACHAGSGRQRRRRCKEPVICGGYRTSRFRTALYVPPWKSSAGDEFKPYLPNANGAMVLVRAQDGVHFTPAGYDMVMASVYPAIRDALSRRGQHPEAKCQYEAKTR